MSDESTLRSIVYNGRVYTDTVDVMAWMRKEALKPGCVPIVADALSECAQLLEGHSQETLELAK